MVFLVFIELKYIYSFSVNTKGRLHIRQCAFIYLYVCVYLYLEADKSVEQQASSMGDKIMGISIRNLCWQARKPIPVTLFKHCLFKMTEKIR